MTEGFDKFRSFFTRFRDLTTLGFSTVISNAISGIFWLFIASLLGTENYGEVSYLIAISHVVLAISSVRCLYILQKKLKYKLQFIS